MLPRMVVLSYASTEVHQSLYRQSRETVTELHGCDAGFVRHCAQAMGGCSGVSTTIGRGAWVSVLSIPSSDACESDADVVAQSV